MHRTKRKPLAEQFATLDEPVTAEATTTEPLQLLDEPERPPIEWPAEERRKRTMPITIQFVFLALACVCFLLAGFNAPVSPRVNMIGLGLFFWVLSLMVRTA
jgi:hypothetical protein